MNSKFFNWLLETESVRYVYNRGSIIYDVRTDNSDIDFLVIVDSEFAIPEEFEKYKTQGYRHRKITYNIVIDNEDYIFFTTDEWFDKVLHGDLIAWECACLPSKFIHKEYVKLLLKTDPVQLRKDFDNLLDLKYSVASEYYIKEEYRKWKKELWDIIRICKFSSQIIENHKIINFKGAMPEYSLLVNNNIHNCDVINKMWFDCFTNEYSYLKQLTDGMLEKAKLKKINQDA